MKTRAHATNLFCLQTTFSMIGIALLLGGCSHPLNTDSPVQTNVIKTIESVFHQTQNKKYTEAEETTKAESSMPKSANTVAATVEHEQLTLSTHHFPAGKVQLKINNLDTETLDVLILQTDLPVEAIPIKDGRVDFSTATVKLAAQLVDGPIPILGSDHISCNLEPGNYVVMVYPTGKIYNATKQIITATATSEI